MNRNRLMCLTRSRVVSPSTSERTQLAAGHLVTKPRLLTLSYVYSNIGGLGTKRCKLDIYYLVLTVQC